MFMTPEEIRKLRKARGWSTEDLAQRVGCTARTIRRVGPILTDSGDTVRIPAPVMLPDGARVRVEICREEP